MDNNTRKKTKKLIVTFETNSQAMAAEAALSGNACSGRLIPLPQQISSGCGLAWCALPQDEAVILAALRSNKLGYGEAVILEMY